MNNRDLLDQAPTTARNEFADLLAEIAATQRAKGLRRNPVLRQKITELQAMAVEPFARHFLPLVAPGEWRENRHLGVRFRIGDSRLDCPENMHVFRLEGTTGLFRPGHAVLVMVPFLMLANAGALHGQRALFSFGAKFRRTCTLEVDTRLACLSWLYPGTTGLIVLATPKVLAKGREIHRHQ